MKRYILLSALLLALTSPSSGTTIQLLPPIQNVDVSDSVFVDIVASDLGAFAAPSIGGFDLDINYDGAVLAPVDFTFGNLLGDLLFVEAVGFFIPGNPITVSETSLLSAAQLDALQPASFSLGTLEFLAIAEGSSALTISNPVVADGFGGLLDLQTAGGRVTVGEEIPEPGSIALVGLGLVALLLGVRRRGQERRP